VTSRASVADAPAPYIEIVSRSARRWFPPAVLFAISAAYTAVRVTGWPTGIVPGQHNLDFAWLVWGPVRGLLDGYNVYDAHSPYVHLFHVGGPATAHTPASLLLLSPFAAPPLAVAGWLFFVLNLGCIWAALWLLVRPATRRQELAAACAAALVVAGGFGELLLELGNFQCISLLGLALLVRFPSDRRGIAGVILLAFVPQTAVPMSVLLARGRGRTLLRGWLAALVLSVPALVMAGIDSGPRRLITSLLDSVPATAENPHRVDVVGQLFGHPGAVAVVGLVLAAIGVWWQRWEIAPGDLRRLSVAVTVVTLVWYHEPTDLVLLGAVVLAAAASLWSRVEFATAAFYLVACVATSGLVYSALVHTVGEETISLYRLFGRLAALGLGAGALATWWVELRTSSTAETRAERVSLRRAS